MTVCDFIEQHWQGCTREVKVADGFHMALPYPFTSPTETDRFMDMFYWDTYFTNVGLLLSDRAQQARYNIDNMLYLVDKYGFMPNVTNKGSLNRSQPPVLSLMVRDYLDAVGDIDWLRGAYPSLEKEYVFWMERRITPLGLNRYGGDVTEASAAGFYRYYCGRTGLTFDDPDTFTFGANVLAEGESGWDYTPRYDRRATEVAAVDLNSLLYAFERNMAHFGTLLARDDVAVWTARADRRLALMNEHLWDADRGLFTDKNFVTGEFGALKTAASYFALLCGVANDTQAESMRSALAVLELPHGITCCDKHDVDGIYQWGYPNCWAPLTYAAVRGLETYGYAEDAERLSRKYCEMLERCFAETGNLWEKYNAINGTVNVVTDEGDMPPMLGWTAGVYLYCKQNA